MSKQNTNAPMILKHLNSKIIFLYFTSVILRSRIQNQKCFFFLITAIPDNDKDNSSHLDDSINIY